MTPDLVFRDPYFLDFLGLTGQYAEKDMEQAILRELEAFILELGSDFAFVARQKRITVDGEDYYLDLLFYHRRLRRLVAIDLKLGKFQTIFIKEVDASKPKMLRIRRSQAWTIIVHCSTAWPNPSWAV